MKARSLEKDLELNKFSQLKSLDRHELEKIMDELGFEVFPYMETQSIREDLCKFMKETEAESIWELKKI